MLTPFATVAGKDAIKAFGTRRGQFCDDQFVATDTDMICLFDEGSAKVDSPSSVKWTPARDYKINPWSMQGPPVWMPKAPKDRYQIFLRSADGYTYLGPARLSAHSRGTDPWAVFQLEQKLPKEEWIKRGGFGGWIVRGDRSDKLSSDELGRLDAILAGAWAGLHIALTRYEGDELILSTNDHRGLLRYNDRRVAGDLPPESAPEVFWSKQHSLEFYAPAEHTLPLDQALVATRTFFATGNFPDWLVWEQLDGSDDDWLFREIVTSLRHLFGYSLADAKQLLSDYLSLRKEWQEKHGPTFHDQEMLRHEGPESMAYMIQWWVGLGRKLGSLEFLDWRKQDYQRRESARR